MDADSVSSFYTISVIKPVYYLDILIKTIDCYE